MNMKQRVLSALAIGAAACLAVGARAQTLDVTLTQTDVSVGQGATAADFFGTVSSPATNTATIYLNGEGISSPAPGSMYLTDPQFSSVFYTNAPLSLDPGTNSGPIDLF